MSRHCFKLLIDDYNLMKYDVISIVTYLFSFHFAETMQILRGHVLSKYLF